MECEKESREDLLKEIEDLRRQARELREGSSRRQAERARAEEALRKSEEWHRSLIQLSASVYAVVDAEGKVLYESPSLQRAYGWKPEELVGKHIFELVHPNDVELAKESFGELLAKRGRTRTVELRYLHKDGSWRTLEVTGVNLLGNPAVAGIVLTSHDVTERKWAEEALRQEKGRFAAFIEDSAFGYIEMDLQGNLTFVNRRVEEMSGYSAEELCKMHFSKLLVPEELERAQEELHQALTEPNTGPRFHKVRVKDGTVVDIEVNNLPLMKAGKPFGFQITIEDISGRREAE